MNVRAVLTGKLNTSIIAFADDIILLNPSLGQLQEIMNNCVDFGRVWIEIQQNKNTICDIRNILIAKPKQNLREHHYATIYGERRHPLFRLETDGHIQPPSQQLQKA